MSQPAVIFVDDQGLESVDWPTSDAAVRARRHFEPMIRDGTARYVENAGIAAAALVLDDQFLPLAVSDGRPDDAGICSVHSHYIGYPMEEVARLRGRLRALAALTFLSGLRPIVSLGGLGRVVYMNDWLLSTNPPLELRPEQVAGATRHLVERFPDRAIIVRSVNNRTSAPALRALEAAGFELIRSRRIYIFDARSSEFKPTDNLKRDLRLLSRWGGTIRELSDPSSDEVGRLRELYERLYLGKYSQRNARLTEAFFELLAREKVFRVMIVERGKDICAFAAWFEGPSSSTAELVGYDLDAPRSDGLLRMAFTLMFREAIEKRTVLNVSAGNGPFKRLRGAEPTIEFHAVHFGHLRCRQRAAWRSFKWFMDQAARAEGDVGEDRRAPTGF